MWQKLFQSDTGITKCEKIIKSAGIVKCFSVSMFQCKLVSMRST